MLLEKICAPKVPGIGSRFCSQIFPGERGSVRHEIEATTGAHLWVELREQTALVQVAGNVSAVERAITRLDREESERSARSSKKVLKTTRLFLIPLQERT